MNRINQITKFHNTLQYLHLLPKDEQINEINQLIKFFLRSQSIPIGFAHYQKSFINHSKHIKNNEIN